MKHTIKNPLVLLKGKEIEGMYLSPKEEHPEQIELVSKEIARDMAEALNELTNACTRAGWGHAGQGYRNTAYKKALQALKNAES